jgi:hypothetical protein
VVSRKEEFIPLLKENFNICIQRHLELEREQAEVLAILNNISKKIENKTHTK